MTPQPPRSVFVQWPLLLREGQRVLDDLAAWTDLNTIELSNFYLDWGETDSWEEPNPPAPLALPATAEFAGLPVPLLDDAAFEPVLGVIEAIKASGFSVACNVAPLYLAEAGLGRLACIDVTGRRARGLRSSLAVYGCPSNPEVVAYGEAMMRGFATFWPTADVITLNHVEYPFWPQLAVSELFTCFCDSCRARAEASGLDFERVRAEVASAYALFTTRGGRGPIRAIDMLTLLAERPNLAVWLGFRLDSMSDYVRRVVEAGREAAATHNPELKIDLEFQAPAASPLVGTDFRRLAPLFDWLTPKFPDYLSAAVVPFVADELGDGGAAELRAALRELLLLGPGPAEYEPATDSSQGIRYRNAFDLEMIDLQVPLLGDLPATTTVYPYLWLYEGDTRALAQKVEAIGRHGFDGYFLWAWDDDLTTDALKQHRASPVKARSVRVAVIGTGRMGAFRADWLRRHPDVDEVLVGSVRAGTVRAVLDAGPDAVVVSSATPDHPDHIALCAERGLPVLCEKPIAPTLAETSAAIELGGPLLQVSFQRRFDPGFAAARRLVSEGALGTLYCIRMTSFDHEPSPEHFIPGSGGIFRDLLIHDFDLARWLTGLEVETVYATGAVRHWERFARHGDVDTSATVLTMTGGLPVLSAGTRHDPRGYDVRAELLGSADSIAVGLDRRTPLRSVEEDPPQLDQEPYTSFLARFERAFDGEMRAWLEFVRGRRENPCPGVEALHALRVAIACDRSLAERRPVAVGEISD